MTRQRFVEFKDSPMKTTIMGMTQCIQWFTLIHLHRATKHATTYKWKKGQIAQSTDKYYLKIKMVADMFVKNYWGSSM